MIFQTQLKCKGRIANLVIDNGSAISFLAQEIIGKLHWPTEKLHKPYKVTWSNGFITPVIHRSLASFPIGGYGDKICFDVIPMNTTHSFGMIMAYRSGGKQWQREEHIPSSGKDKGLH